MTKSMMVAAVLAAVAIAGPALAHGKRGGEYYDLRRNRMIKKFDQDGDGRLSRAERRLGRGDDRRADQAAARAPRRLLRERPAPGGALLVRGGVMGGVRAPHSQRRAAATRPARRGS